MKKNVISVALVIVVIAAAVCWFLLTREPEPIAMEYKNNGTILASVSIPVENGSEDFQCIFSGEVQTEKDLAFSGYVIRDVVATKFDFKKDSFNYAPLYTAPLEIQSHNNGRVALTQPMELIVNGMAVGDILAKVEFLLDPASGKLSVASSSAVYTPFPDSEFE